MDKDHIKKLCIQYDDGELSMKNFMDALDKGGVPYHLIGIIGDLYHKVSFLTNLSKLTEEEQAIAIKWEKEREERAQFFNDMIKISKKDPDKKLTDLLQNMPEPPMVCEHGRHIVKTCLACEHIERTLFPDMFIGEDDE